MMTHADDGGAARCSERERRCGNSFNTGLFFVRRTEREREDDERERERGKGEQYLHSLSRCVLNHE